MTGPDAMFTDGDGRPSAVMSKPGPSGASEGREPRGTAWRRPTGQPSRPRSDHHVCGSIDDDGGLEQNVMCNRARLSYEPETLRTHFGADWLAERPMDNRFNPRELTPRSRAWIVRRNDRGVGIDIMSWDVLGGQAKWPMTNVRNLLLPQWRRLAERPGNRCLVPLTEFCEWTPDLHDVGGGKPLKGEMWFQVTDQPLFAVAGFWQPTAQGAGFAMVTCKCQLPRGADPSEGDDHHSRAGRPRALAHRQPRRGHRPAATIRRLGDGGAWTRIPLQTTSHSRRRTQPALTLRLGSGSITRDDVTTTIHRPVPIHVSSTMMGVGWVCSVSSPTRLIICSVMDDICVTLGRHGCHPIASRMPVASAHPGCPRQITRWTEHANPACQLRPHNRRNSSSNFTSASASEERRRYVWSRTPHSRIASTRAGCGSAGSSSTSWWPPSRGNSLG